MSRGKKIIYTESAKERLEKLHFEVNKEIEDFLQERKYIPGEDFIEITALDIDEVSKRFRIVRNSPSRYMRSLIPALYSVVGTALVVVGLFYEDIITLIKDNPLRLMLIGTGFVMVGMSWLYLYLIRIRDRKNELEKEILLEKSVVVDNDEVLKSNITRIVSDQRVIVHSAKYFFEKNYLNVTSKVKELVDNNIFEFTVSNDLMGGDPAHGKVKTLEIEYSIDGVKKKATAIEGAILNLI